MRPTRHRTLWARPLAGTLAAVLLTTSACSGDEPKDDSDEPRETATTESAAPPLETTASIGEVVGKLGKKKRNHLVDKVAAMVDEWIDAAYVGGDYPRDDFGGSFAVFTKDAAGLAEKQAGVMSNAAIGEDVDTVEATKRIIKVDVLAAEGRPAGVTARFRLVMAIDGDDRKEQVRGRLVLTKAADGWQVFGFDVTRGKVGKR